MNSKRDLTTGPIARKLSQLTLPMMLGIISMVAFNLVDTYFVGKLGQKELAALSFTFPVIMVVFSLVQGLGIGATALISKSFGKRDMNKAARETTDSLILAILIAGVFVVIGLLTVEPTFRLLGASDEILPYTVEYMSIWYMAIMFVIVPFVGNSAIRATGDARTPSMIMIFAVLINAILDPILIFGFGPIPSMGLKGAAYATAISRAMTMVLAFGILYYREKLITFKIPSWNIISGCWKAILYIGLPSGISRMVVPFAIGIVTSLLAKHGDTSVAAFGVGSRLEFLAMSLLFALSASIGPFSGQNLGAGRIDRIKKGVNLSNRFAIAWGILCASFLYLFAKDLAGIFSDSKEVIDETVIYLQIIPMGFGIQGIVNIVNSNLNTLNKPIPASLIIVIQMLVLGIPLLYLGSSYGGTRGIFVALVITYVLGGIISLIVNYRLVNNLEVSFSKK